MRNAKLPAIVTILAVILVLVLGKLGVIGFLFRILWPILLLGLGILLHYGYYRGKWIAAVLLPAGMIVVYAVLFILCTIFGWGILHVMWPIFILGVAVGLYEWASWGRGLGWEKAQPVALLLAAFSGVCLILAILSTNLVLFCFILLAAAVAYIAFRYRFR
ncbi:hypothetical protein [Gorillibacterium timonense]|uniref:hypothetical protein n=1 Tax=Gorillibacterium timonense TaxID=1689269 RepID=UPI00071D533E|nr:hypothetical protein [Gorillibacterium timonense]